jgi:branched-chain amino acid transport system permease protein
MAFIQIMIYGIINGALYGLYALGLSLVFGVMSYLNVAHGALIMFASYACFWAFQLLNMDPFISLVILVPAFFVLGLILFQLLFKRLISLTEGEKIKNSLLIAFGLLLIIPNLAILFWTADERAVTTFYSGEVVSFLGLRIPYIGLGTLALAVVVILALHLFLTRTYPGKAIRAVSQDHESAGLMGINTTRIYIAAFAIGVALASVPGILVALQGFNPEFATELTCKALIVVILAGVGSINGVLLGGVLLGAVEAASVLLMGAAYREVIGLVIFVLLLLFRPQGLLGKKA